MDRCHSVQNILADYRSGLLSAGKRDWVQAHCAECSECAKELRALDDVLALVDANTPMQEPPAGLWNGVANRIASPERSAVGHWWTRPLRLAGVGVAALALVFAMEFGGAQRDSVVPVEMVSGNEYVQGHALYAGQAPMADRVGYLSLVASNEVQPK